MRGSTNQKMVILVAVLATAGSLNQCAKDLGRHLQPPRAEQVGFGPVEFNDAGVTDLGGRIVDMVTVSTQARSWNQASNLFRPWEACTEGRDYEYTQRNPAVDIEDEDAWFRELPKGTRFVQRVACEGPLPNELEWTAGLLPPDAMQRVIRRLKHNVPKGTDGEVPGLEFRSGWFGQDYLDKRYEAFNKALGDATKDQRARCGGAVTLVDIATISEPDNSSSNRNRSKTLIVGMYFECAAPSHAATTSTAATATSNDSVSPP